MLLALPEAIGAVLALTPLPQSLAELESHVTIGLPREALQSCIGQVTPSPEEQRRLRQQIVPDAAERQGQERLSVRASQRLERLARVYATALTVWNDDESARAFLKAPHPMLEGRAPLDVALSELGARRVEMLLGRLYWGVAA